MKKNIAYSVAVGLAFTLSTGTAFSSGYGVNLFSGYAAGMANAGHGVQDDPMLTFVNPASAILSKCHHAAMQVTGVIPYTKFKGTATRAYGLGGPAGVLPLPGSPGAFADITGKSKNAAKFAAIPTSGFVWRLHEDLRLSLAMNSPFGLKFDYGNNSPTQFHTIRGSMLSVNISPSVAYRIHEMITLGIGFQAQYTKVKLKRHASIPVFGADVGTVRLKVDNWNHGWTAGALLNLTKQWNLGLSYRSNIDANLHGKLYITTPLVTLLNPQTQQPVTIIPASGINGSASAKAFIPHTFTISSSYSITPKWTLYGSAVWTAWGKTKNLTIRSSIISAASTGTLGKEIIEQKWKNVWFYSAGVDYKINEAFAVRTGLGYDNSPTKNSTRIPAIPDSDKVWFGLGGTYTRGKWAATLTYGHEFFKKGKINLDNNVTLTKSTLNGRIKAHIDLVSLQINYRF